MLVELRVSHLGVIEDQSVMLGPGLNALTGETGAGKTLLVGAISLLTGGPSDAGLVAPGAAEARVEGRFIVPAALAATVEGGGADVEDAEVEEADGEVVLCRVVPAAGRSRSYIDGRMVSSTLLAETGRRLIDIHGQNTHQTLLSPAAQRRSLDLAAGVDTSLAAAARRRVREITRELDGMGGDPRERARQIDLLNYQLTEMDKAEIDRPDEDADLVREEELLADSSGLIDAAQGVWEGLSGDDGVVERLGPLAAVTAARPALTGLHTRLIAVQEELSDIAASARQLSESVDADPERLVVIGERRRILTEMRRKYGPSLADVIEYRERLRRDVEDLASHEERAAVLGDQLEAATKTLEQALRDAWQQRVNAASGLASAVEERLHELAMPRARFAIEVGPDPADEAVTWLLSANPGQPLQPLAKVASGGELARAMLASRLVMRPAADGAPPEAGRAPGDPTDSPGTLVFDEVDAGIGGEAALAVGRALAALGDSHQVLVVTHLAQVAAFAASHLSVAKTVVAEPDGQERTVATAAEVNGRDRVVELARMLSGRPDSRSALAHAAELLEEADRR
jgi:DNA repair protein RecN (Recombination protein N)